MKLAASDYAALSKRLDAALDMPSAALADWLERVDASDEPFKGILRTLLQERASVESRDFLDRLPEFPPAPGLAGAAAPAGSATAGDEVGPYQLVKEIGRGGMAAVWQARRTDGSIDRKIALKLPFADGLDRRTAERFAAERNILAALAHARIARLYDAGVTPGGQPYLAMEFIEGLPITAYCDEQRLDVRQRVMLFLQVLDATRHAHLQMVLHRDLKPSNILVTSAGQVALLDFGIAKLLVDGETHQTQFSRLGGRALTPAYASPEQLTDGVLGTASDVYSLGVVLYELLTGNRPYRLKRESRLSLEAAIVEADAVRPSQALVTAGIAKQRATTPKALARTLRGDLDTIILKALKKAPVERYPTADGFAADLERYLCGKPVLARADSVAYLLRKFVARHRVIVAVVSICVVSLILAAAGSIWQANVARVQAARAQTAARRAIAVQDFLLDLFRANSDAQSDPVQARQMTARQILDIGAQRVDAKMQSEPAVQEEIQDTLADMYIALGLDREAGRIQAARIGALTRAYGEQDPRIAAALLTYAQTLYITDGYVLALPQLQRAADLLDAAGDRSSVTRGQLLIDWARLRLGASPASSQRYADEAVTFFIRYPSPDDWLATAYLCVARARYALGDFAAAEANYRLALAAAALVKPAPLSTELTATVGLAEAEAKLGQVEDAERELRAILVKSQQRNGIVHLDTLQVETRLGALLYATSRREEGRHWLRDAVHQVELNQALDTPNLSLVVNRNWGLSLLADGRFELAALVLANNARLRRARDPGTTTLAIALRDLGVARAVLGQYGEAQALTEEASALWRSAVGGAAETDAGNGYVLAEAQVLLARGDARGALARLQDAVQPATTAPRLPTLDQLTANIARSRAYVMLGRDDDALRLAGQVLSSVQQSPERVHNQALEADALAQFGQAQRLTGHAGLARPYLERAVLLRSGGEAPTSPWLAAARVELAECLLDLGERAAAGRLREQARSALATHPQIADEFARPLQLLTARLHP